MSCYLRHLGGLFHEAGLEYNRENRKVADAQIRALLGLAGAECGVVWRAVKPLLESTEGRARLVEAMHSGGSS